MTEKAKAILDDLVKKITTENTLQFIHQKLFSERIEEIPCQKWSMMNQFMVFLSGTSDARGIRQWAKVGRNVIKGSKAVYILAPTVMTIKHGNNKDMKDKKEKDEEYEEDSEDDTGSIRKITGFKALPVFRLEDTEGEALDYQRLLQSYDPASLPLIEIAHKLGVKVEARLDTGRSYGFYHPLKKEIVMGTDDAQVFLYGR
jgi:hypothetical protein